MQSLQTRLTFCEKRVARYDSRRNLQTLDHHDEVGDVDERATAEILFEVIGT